MHFAGYVTATHDLSNQAKCSLTRIYLCNLNVLHYCIYLIIYRAYFQENVSAKETCSTFSFFYLFEFG